LRRDEEGSSLARDIDETILVHKGVRTFSDKNVERVHPGVVQSEFLLIDLCTISSSF
jgi:hypothetical protein